jgi:2-keto-3-deoxy-L-rhamnonate aldolase RhmA
MSIQEILTIQPLVGRLGEITLIPRGLMRDSKFLSKSKEQDPMFGTFIKIPDIAVVETLAESHLDFIVIDQEHAPFDRRSLDTLLFAARSLGLPALVRVCNSDASTLLAALDGGAAGVLLPHIDSAAVAHRAAAACRYRTGRGYSGAVRSTRNRGNLSSAIEAVDSEIAVIVQIEDAPAIDLSAEIAACNGIDALFIGRGDLAVSLAAASSAAPEVWAAARRIADAAARHEKAIWAFAANWREADQLLDLGARTIIFGSDQSHLKAGTSQLVAEARRRNRQSIPQAKQEWI